MEKENDAFGRGGVEDTKLETKANDTKKVRGQGQAQPFRGQTPSRPRTGMLEAKDQRHNAEVVYKKKQKTPSLQKFLNFPGDSGIFPPKKVFAQTFSNFPENSSDLQEKNVFKNFFASSLVFFKTKQNWS